MSFRQTTEGSETAASGIESPTESFGLAGDKILISRLSAHGDVVQTLPLLVHLKTQNPSLFVGWVVEESAAPLLMNHPMIDRLHIFKRKQWLESFKRPSQWGQVRHEFQAFVQELKQECYSVGVDVQGLLKSAIVLWLAGIPRRIGYHQTRENASFFYTETIPHHDLRNPDIPTVAIFSEFARSLGYPTPTRQEAADLMGESAPLPYAFVTPSASPETQARVAALLKPIQGKHPLIAIAPETIWPAKHWISDSWKTVLTHCARQGFSVVFIGSEKGATQAEALMDSLDSEDRQRLNALNLAGQTTWEDMYEVFRHVDVLLGLDSAPLHIANAVGHPSIVGLYGPTGVRRTGPVGLQHRGLSTNLDCQPCFQRICPLGTHECMHQISPDAVINALEDVLAQRASMNTREIITS